MIIYIIMDKLNSEIFATYIDHVYENQKEKFRDFPDSTYPINKEYLKKIKTEYGCGNNFTNFLINFYDLVEANRITVNDFRTIYERGVNDLIKNSEICELVLVIGLDMFITKSAFWISMYIYGKFKEKGFPIKYVVRTLSDIIDTNKENWMEYNKIKTKSGKRFIIALICDDVSYSGNQLGTEILDFNTKVTTKQTNLYVYFCVAGFTSYAKKDILKRKDATKIFFIPNYKEIYTRFEIFTNLHCAYSYVIESNECERIFDNIDMLTIEKMPYGHIIRSLFLTHYEPVEISTDAELSCTYTDIKYPDGMSTQKSLCRIPVLSDYEFLYSKLSEKSKKAIINRFTQKNSNKIFIDEKLIEELFDDLKIGIISKFPSVRNYVDLSSEQLAQLVNDILIDVMIINGLLRKCNDIEKKISLIMNCEYDPYTCSKCPVPFYKKLNYNDPDTHINSENLQNSFDEWCKANSIIIGGSYYKKYIKYKNKYLTIKHSLNV